MPVPACGLTRALATNSTAANFASLVPVTTLTISGSVNGVYDLRPQPPDNILLILFGTLTAGQTGNMRLWGWRQTGNGVWVQTLLAELLGTATAAANKPVAATADLAATDVICDTLSLVQGATANVSCEVVSPGGSSLTAHAVVDLKGSQVIQFDPKKGTGTDVNALWGRL